MKILQLWQKTKAHLDQRDGNRKQPKSGYKLNCKGREGKATDPPCLNKDEFDAVAV